MDSKTLEKLSVDLLLEKSKDIEGAIAKVREYAGDSEEVFEESPMRKASAKYELLIAIEGVLALCNHIVARLSTKVPQNYGACLTLLAEVGVIPSELGVKLRELIGLRNILIHRYWTVNDQLVYQFIQEDLENFEAFIGWIARLMKKMEGGKSNIANAA